MGLASKIKLFWTAGRGLAKGLPDASESSNPLELFGSWFEAARQTGILLPEATTLSTATSDGKPSSRMVLLKDHGPDGFVFFTNYGSRKASEIDANPQAALLFHWAVLQRQIRIEGRIERISKEKSTAYFNTRSRESKIGAWASHQSKELESRALLESTFKRLASKYEGKEIPLPEFWGGYRLIPESIEFWQGRANRLHDRLLFVRDGDSWISTRLYP
ncbi:MAG: pyridoxamine 5'-phosphate oxidase [Rhodothermia bacterium]|nr:MAG: pyridoxamine 5'-phosphate oxidase [Rhodothermia bacterium]